MVDHPDLTARFVCAMERLGPFEPAPLLAVAVSGGADSMALALLADAWARAHSGSVIAFVVDHGLRPASNAEALQTIERLTQRAIPARLLRIAGLARGSALAQRARTERYRVLVEACAEIGCLHLLLGHHSADQAETVMMRVLGNSRSVGLAAMPALTELPTVRLLRPLLSVAQDELRDLLRAEGVAWVDDPSNRDPAALRARLRATASADPAPVATAATAAGHARSGAEMLGAAVLAERVKLYPEGFAVISPGRIHPDALAAVVQTIAGAAFPPPSAAIERLAAALGPATLAGVRVLPAGRFGRGWLVVREAAAMQPPVEADRDAVWDGRFRLTGTPPAGANLGALGAGMTLFRSRSRLPAAVLSTLPALRRGLKLVAVPHLGYPQADNARVNLLFCPPRPMAGAPFRPALMA